MKMKLKGVLTLSLVQIFSIFSASAVDLTFRITPSMFMPLQENYTPAFSGFIQADVELFGFLTAGVEGTFSLERQSNMPSMQTSFGGGLGLGAFFYPMSRIHLGAGGAVGIYSTSVRISDPGQGQDESSKRDITLSDLYWRAYGEAGFRINPYVTINAYGGYMSYLVNQSSPLMTGPYAGVSARISISVGKSGANGFRVSVSQDEPAYPVFMGLYKNCGLATINLTNQEGAEIRNVQVSFRAGKYTTETMVCESIPRINKYETREIPLTASFSDEILKFSENGKISGEVVVDYTMLGVKKQSVQTVIIDVYNRNAFSWYDNAALAAFISPDVPEIYEFSKAVAGTARNGYRTGISRNLENAAALVEAMVLAKVEYSGDKETPYLTFHNSDEIDMVQHPLQTMNFLGGDYDDLGIFLASCLESIGVPTGYMICDDDFIVLVDMQIKPSAAENNFGDTEKLVISDSTVFFGLSMKNLSKGFTKGLNSASDTIKNANNGQIDAEYVVTHEAWDTYTPAIYSGTYGLFKNPSQSELERAYKKALDNYVNTEIKMVLDNARASGDPNKLGLAYVRTGRYSEAKAEFSKSNTITSMINLANVYILEKNYNAAINQYNKVLAIDPENEKAKKGIDKANTLKGL